MKGRQIFILIAVLLLAGIGVISLFWKSILWSLIIIVPLVLIGIRDMLQTRQTIRRNFPLIGNVSPPFSQQV